MMKYSDRPNTYINAKDLEIAIVKATSYGDALDAVREAPSIDIIRCGECKYYEAKEDWCYWRDEAITADDFCSYGSRSEKPNNCDACKYGEDKHRYAHFCNECGVGINNYEPKDEQTEREGE